MRKSLTVVLITLNEAENLPRTLASIRFATEIIVVDSGSTDATEQIARAAGARFFTEPWRGFGAQKNAALERANCTWILSLDADEELSSELQQEILDLLDSTDEQANAYQIPRLNHFLGQPLRHGGYWPDRKLRLFRNGRASFRDQAIHETMQADGPIGQLKHPLLHHCYPTLEEYVEHMNRYSSVAARQLLASGRAPRSLIGFITKALLNPAFTFFYNYVVRLGFLDGRAGLLQHLNHSAYIHWKYVKAWELSRAPKPSIHLQA